MLRSKPKAWPYVRDLSDKMIMDQNNFMRANSNHFIRDYFVKSRIPRVANF